MIDLNFDKLFLVRDSEYGTHVTYICDYPDKIYLDFFTDSENLNDIFSDIKYYIEKRVKID